MWLQSVSTSPADRRKLGTTCSLTSRIFCRHVHTILRPSHLTIVPDQVNVFELGHTYLQLVQTLNLRLPLVDPSHYISRFSALLEFGDETPKVAADAVRLVARMDRDWMRSGRRPAGICGACLLLAARMNNFRRSVQEIVQVVKIADTTLKKRLDEFRRTPSGGLTLADFRSVWLEDEMDPPAYTEGKEREAREKEKELQVDVDVGEEDDANGMASRMKRRKKKGKKRKRGKEVEVEENTPAPPDKLADVSRPEPPIDPQLLKEGILSEIPDIPLFLPDVPSTAAQVQGVVPTNGGPPANTTDNECPLPLDATVDSALADEVTTFLQNQQGSQISGALDEADERRHAGFTGDDELLGLDETELDAFILTEDEVMIKERVWVEINKDYLEALAGMA